MNAIIYARVSSDEQVKGYSLPTQIEACRKYATEQGYVVVAEFKDDYTGASLDRPGLNQLRAFVAIHPADSIIVYDVDRLARKAAYQFLIEEEFQRAGIRIEYVIGGYDDTPEGQLLKQMRANVAEYERAKIQERTLRGKRGRAQAGFVHVGRTAPFGYRYLREQHKGWLEIVEEEAEIVQLIFRWYVIGDESGQRLGSGAIAHRLSLMRVPTKNDVNGGCKNKKDRGIWAASSVKRILKSTVYAGTWYYNRSRRMAKGHTVGRDRSEWIGVTVPRIIEQDLWEAAQKQMVANRVLARRNTRRDYLLQGRLTCADCGMTFLANTETRRHPHGYYRCGGQKVEHSKDYTHKPCHRSLRQDSVDEKVWERIKRILENPDTIIESMRQKKEKGAN